MYCMYCVDYPRAGSCLLAEWRQLSLQMFFSFCSSPLCSYHLPISIQLLLAVAVFLPHSTFPHGSLLDITVLHSASHRRRWSGLYSLHIVVHSTVMPQGKQLQSHAKEIVMNVYRYFERMDKKSKGPSLSASTSEATGELCLEQRGDCWAWLDLLGVSVRSVQRLLAASDGAKYVPQGSLKKVTTNRFV